MRFCRPLHRRAGAIALGKFEIVPHTDFVAITKDRRSGQGEHQAVRKLDTPPVTIEHGHEPAPDAALIELHFFLGSEACENALALLLGQPAEIQLVVIAQKQTPLRRRGPRFRGFERSHQRPAVRGCQRVK